MALAAVGNMEHNGQQFFFKEQQLSVDFSVAIMQSPKGRSIDFSVAISLRFHLGPSQTVPASPTQQDLLHPSCIQDPNLRLELQDTLHQKFFLGETCKRHGLWLTCPRKVI
ncbi:uncharacterized protein LOC108999805 isoform X3 [Juglans regia]|uniref:Uncharacterized protein LOC108999805 isoform X3 n=1 Tax=Juglans regia TaxID=51240 RepID=A0A6P9E7B0_JUGRE|nr:uncharacterized protein LOC108999805 isoform X3 [Juglans regia]